MSSSNLLSWAIIGGSQEATSYYATRNAARDANKAIKGKLTQNKLGDADVAAAAEVAATPTHEAELAAAEAAIVASEAPAPMAPNPFERLGALETLEAPKLSQVAREPAKCVACGSLNLFTGEVNETTGIVENEEYILGCHDCGHVVDSRAVAVKSAKEKRIVEKVNFSTVECPTKAVWHIADELRAANPSIRRKDLIEECQKRGIAFYTARTQIQSYLACQKEMSARQAATEAAEFSKMKNA